VLSAMHSSGASQRSCFLAWRTALRLQALRHEVWARAEEAQRQHDLVDLVSAGYTARLAVLEGWRAWQLARWMTLAGIGGGRSAALRRPFTAWRVGVQRGRQCMVRLAEAEAEREAETCRRTLLLASCCSTWKEATHMAYWENQGRHQARVADQRLVQAEALAWACEQHSLVLRAWTGWREACPRGEDRSPSSPDHLAEGDRTQTSLQTQTPLQTPIRTEDHAKWLASVLEASGGTVPKEYPPVATGLPSMLRGLARAAVGPSGGSCAAVHEPCGMPVSPGPAATTSAEFDKAGSAWADLHCKHKALWCAQADLKHFGLVVAGLEAQLQC